MQQTAELAEELRVAVNTGQYDRAAEIGGILRPGMEPQLNQFRLQMDLYEVAKVHADWRRALRALADARIAAIAAELPELETVVTDKLYQVVKLHEGRR